MELDRKKSLLEREILFLVESLNYNSCLYQFQETGSEERMKGKIGTKIECEEKKNICLGL